MTKLLWTQRANFGPSPRAGSGMAHDSNRVRTVLFGGNGPTGEFSPLGDTWEWDGSFWAQMQDVGPAPRSAFGAMVYDSARHVSVLFGGAGPDQPAGGGPVVPRPLGDTWQWNGSNWTQISDSGPAARFDHAAAFDSGRNRLVLFGGRGPAATTLSDTWEFDGQRWTQMQGAGPPARHGHAMVYDGAGRVVLFGGEGSGQQMFTDTWAWNGMEWAQIAEFGPSARVFAAMASLRAGNLVLYGGQSSSQPGAALLADTWQFDGTLWTDRQDIGPGPLASAAVTFDSARQKVILFGGVGSAATESGLTWETAVMPVPSPIRVVSLAFPPNVSVMPAAGIFPQFVVTLSGPAPASGSRVNVTGGPIFGLSIGIGQNVNVNVSPLQAVTVPVGSIAVSTVFAVPPGSAGTQISVSAEIPGTPAVSASFYVD